MTNHSLDEHCPGRLLKLVWLLRSRFIYTFNHTVIQEVVIEYLVGARVSSEKRAAES